jgi:hypothetical protein
VTIVFDRTEADGGRRIEKNKLLVIQSKSLVPSKRWKHQTFAARLLFGISVCLILKTVLRSRKLEHVCKALLTLYWEKTENFHAVFTFRSNSLLAICRLGAYHSTGGEAELADPKPEIRQSQGLSGGE